MRHGKHFLSMIDRRSSGFPELTASLLSHLKQLPRTDRGQCFIFPSPATGVLEAVLRRDRGHGILSL